MVDTMKGPMSLRQWLIVAIEADKPEPIALGAMHQFGLSRQTVNRELSKMVSEKLIEATGETRARRYKLISEVTDRDIELTPDLREDSVWRHDILPKLQGLPANVLLICQHGFTEMLNNAIDHSGSLAAKIIIVRNAAKVNLTIFDHGIGIFQKIQKEKHLDDPQEAIFELSKGKLTTDPENHTGEGIFFTSRMFDRFSVMSDTFSLFCSPQVGDWWFDLVDCNVEIKTVPTFVKGTCVMMDISCFSRRTMTEVVNKFAAESDDYSFSRTHVPVRLARYDNAELISRSQAKRLMNRLNRFKEVILDFEGIETIGQGFADQIFRVYRKEHPHVHISHSRTKPAVLGMIRRAETGDVAEGGLETRTPFFPGMEPEEEDENNLHGIAPPRAEI
jgi:anti-sigma regulatory factor (Ser/Thr protein kinase)